MKTAFKWMLVIAGILAGCSTLTGARTLHVTTQQMSRSLAEQLPLEQRWLELFDLRLSDPTITTAPDRQRLRAAFDLTIGDRLFGQRRRAHLVLSARLRHQVSDHSVRLSDVAVDDFAVDGVDDAWLARIASLPAWLLGQGLEDAAVYRLSSADIERMAAAGLAVGELRITERGLQITLVPRGKPEGEEEDTAPAQWT